MKIGLVSKVYKCCRQASMKSHIGLYNAPSFNFFWNKTASSADKTKSENESNLENAEMDMEYKKYVQSMLGYKQFSWKDFADQQVEIYRQSSSTIRGKLSKQKPDKSTADAATKISNNLDSEEQTKLEFSKAEAKELSKSTGLSEVIIDNIVLQYLNNKMIHSYLHKLSKEKKPFPKSIEDLKKKISKDTSSEETKILQNRCSRRYYEAIGMKDYKLQEFKQKEYRDNPPKLKKTRELF